jgi:glutamate racemase
MNSSVENIFYASDLSENFVRMIDRIFKNSDTKVEFKSFDIEEV